MRFWSPCRSREAYSSPLGLSAWHNDVGAHGKNVAEFYGVVSIDIVVGAGKFYFQRGFGKLVVEENFK